MKYISLFLSALILSLYACKKEGNDDNCAGPIEDNSSLIFGHYYGECIGEDCIQTYKLSGAHLYEDTVDSYAGTGPLAFIQRSQEDYLLVSNLMDYYPEELLSQADTTYGCPDCADQGGLFIQLSNEGTVRTFNIDQDMAAVPSYLHLFMTKVNEYIGLIGN